MDGDDSLRRLAWAAVCNKAHSAVSRVLPEATYPRASVGAHAILHALPTPCQDIPGLTADAVQLADNGSGLARVAATVVDLGTRVVGGIEAAGVIIPPSTLSAGIAGVVAVATYTTTAASQAPSGRTTGDVFDTIIGAVDSSLQVAAHNPAAWISGAVVVGSRIQDETPGVDATNAPFHHALRHPLETISAWTAERQAYPQLDQPQEGRRDADVAPDEPPISLGEPPVQVGTAEPLAPFQPASIPYIPPTESASNTAPLADGIPVSADGQQFQFTYSDGTAPVPADGQQFQFAYSDGTAPVPADGQQFQFAYSDGTAPVPADGQQFQFAYSDGTAPSKQFRPSTYDGASLPVSAAGAEAEISEQYRILSQLSVDAPLPILRANAAAGERGQRQTTSTSIDDAPPYLTDASMELLSMQRELRDLQTNLAEIRAENDAHESLSMANPMDTYSGDDETLRSIIDQCKNDYTAKYGYNAELFNAVDSKLSEYPDLEWDE